MPGRIGPYELIEEAGRGGMGVVYRARDALGRTVAVKVPTRAEPGRFLREARLAARLRHPGLATVLGAGTTPEGRPFLALEWVEGQTLARRLRSEGTLDPREACRLVAQLAATVAYLHEAGIVHRDLKPANVIVSDEGRPVLIDFGLAWASTPGDHSLTRSGELLGTPETMAPEQAAGDPSRVGPPADVWALGATLFALLAGRAPFQGESPIQLIRALVEDPVPDLRSLRPELDPALAAACARCLERDPSRRPPAAWLARTLEALAEPRATAPPARSGRRRLAGAVLLGGALLGSLAGSLRPRAPGPPAGGAAPSPAPAASADPDLAGVDQARQRLREGDPAAALALLEDLLRRRPDLADAWAGRGAIRVGRGELDGARADLQRALELDRRQVRYWTLLAELERQAGRPEPAAEALRRALELDAAYPRALLVSATLAADGGDPAEGVRRCDAGLAEHPDDPELLAVRAALQLETGRLEEAFADASRGLSLGARVLPALEAIQARLRPAGRLRLMLELADRLVATRGDDPRLRSWRAGLREELEDPAGALEDLREAVRLAPGDAELQLQLGELLKSTDPGAALAALERAATFAPDLARAWERLGLARLAHGNDYGARQALGRCLELDPDNPEARCGLAALLDGDPRQRPQALALLDAVVESHPEVARGWLLRARVRREMRDLERALADVEAGLARCPDAPELLLERATVQRERGERGDALTCARRVTELLPARFEGWLLLGDLLLAGDDLPAAELAADEALRRSPHAVSALRLRASIRRLRGDLSGALEDADAALARAPDEPWVLLVRGTTRYAAGQPELALDDLERAAALDPRNPPAWCALGEVQHALGRDEAAAASAARAVELDPGLHQGWCLVARLALWRGEQPAARTARERAAAIDDGSGDLLLVDAVALARQGRLAEGRAALELLLSRLAPRDLLHEVARREQERVLAGR